MPSKRRERRNELSELLRKGRLKSARKDVVEFTSSVQSDEKLLKHIVAINKAHIIMLTEKKIISQNDGARILAALAKLDKGIKLRPDVEDAHMAVEEEVIKEVGPDVGGNLNLAKSRNDQVATAIRMNLREELLHLMETMLGLQEVLTETSEKNLETVIPGYTHLQPAQPITFAHYLLAQFDALQRSLDRVEGSYSRVDLCPMGAGALATTSFPISRERVAVLLGFSGVLENSLDAVSTRDFLLEVLAAVSVMAVDVSRFVEDIILWSTMNFGIIELPDEFASTSSIMPQKKNPDVLEVIRARMGLVLSDFTAAATILKALPNAYDFDLQETTPRLWNAIETAEASLSMLSKIIPDLKVTLNLKNKPSLSFLTATELANMLVRKHKVPFRTAHKIVGTLVRTLIEEEKTLADASPEMLAEVSGRFLGAPLNVEAEEIREATDPSSCIEAHKVRGGPAEKECQRMLGIRKEMLTASQKWVLEKKKQLKAADSALSSLVKTNTTANKMSPSHRKV
jgi:argininosuccinate lyase